MHEINGVDEVKALVGHEIAVGDWHEVTQAEINAFADATGDHQFIHIDPERAKQTPFGGTIAHGFYTLSLLPKLTDEMVTFNGFSFAVNYGLNKVRFPAPLRVGAKVRLRSTVTAVDDVPGGIQISRTETFDTDAGEKPVCVAESLARLYV
jgi:acyl dehydratase